MNAMCRYVVCIITVRIVFSMIAAAIACLRPSLGFEFVEFVEIYVNGIELYVNCIWGLKV